VFKIEGTGPRMNWEGYIISNCKKVLAHILRAPIGLFLQLLRACCFCYYYVRVVIYRGRCCTRRFPVPAENLAIYFYDVRIFFIV
jgi:hypothetical protein